MCCIMYYVYLKIRDYVRQPKQEVKPLDEVMYNAQQLNEYVRRKERTYWCCYD